MPVTDPIGDLLARMRNSQRARRPGCTVPHSRILFDICSLLKREGYLGDVKVVGEPPRQTIEITFVPGRGLLELVRVSRPGRRWYARQAEIRPMLRGLGIVVLSTSQGLMTGREARQRGVGGEVLCTVS